MLQSNVQVLDSQPADPVSQAAADFDLEQVLSSRTFERAPTLKKLLLYLWQHREEEISEYAIATEALRRRQDFEPRFDATVRVLVSRLRKRLKEFYDEEGAHLPARIVIPVGTHQIKVLETEQIKISRPEPRESLEDNASAKQAESFSHHRLIIQIQFAVIAVLVACTGWLLWQRHRGYEMAAQGNPVQLPVFWKQFLGNGKSTRIIVPTPVFFSFENGLMARDIHVNHFSDLRNSHFLTAVGKQFGKPSLAQYYVASSDAFASLRLNRFLDSRQQQVPIFSTGEVSMDTLDRENVIVAGNSHTLAVFPQILDRLSFQVDSSKWLVINRQPAPGEPAEIDTIHESEDRILTPGVIASLPGTGTAGTHLLVLLTTYHTSALVSYLTSDEGLKELQRAQEAHGHCPYFQAVIMSEINGTTPLGSKLVVFKPYCSNQLPAFIPTKDTRDAMELIK